MGQVEIADLLRERRSVRFLHDWRDQSATVFACKAILTGAKHHAAFIGDDNRCGVKMVWRHRGVDIPPERYHSVPQGWRADEIIGRHKIMRGTFSIAESEIGKWSAPSWMTERYEWLRYRKTLSHVADGVRAGDEACVEIAIRYIELRHIGTYSGYLRSKLARALKHVSLTDRQKIRLNEHFLNLVLARDYTEKFREYRKLWGSIITEKTLKQVTSHVERPSRHLHGAAWVAGLSSSFEKRSGSRQMN